MSIPQQLHTRVVDINERNLALIVISTYSRDGKYMEREKFKYFFYIHYIIGKNILSIRLLSVNI